MLICAKYKNKYKAGDSFLLFFLITTKNLLFSNTCNHKLNFNVSDNHYGVK